MYLHVDLVPEPPDVSLRQREDCTRLHVEVHGGDADTPGTRARLDQALRASGFGALDDAGPDAGAAAEALLDLGALRAAAGHERPPGWEQDFEAMIGYARTKGWVTDDDHVRAHVVRPPAD